MFGSSGFGGAGGISATNTNSFGAPGFGNTTAPATGFGAPAQNTTGFGGTGFGQTGFGTGSTFGTGGFGTTGFGSTGVGGFGGQPTGASPMEVKLYALAQAYTENSPNFRFKAVFFHSQEQQKAMQTPPQTTPGTTATTGLGGFGSFGSTTGFGTQSFGGTGFSSFGTTQQPATDPYDAQAIEQARARNTDPSLTPVIVRGIQGLQNELKYIRDQAQAILAQLKATRETAEALASQSSALMTALQLASDQNKQLQSALISTVLQATTEDLQRTGSTQIGRAAALSTTASQLAVTCSDTENKHLDRLVADAGSAAQRAMERLRAAPMIDVIEEDARTLENAVTAHLAVQADIIATLQSELSQLERNIK